MTGQDRTRQDKAGSTIGDVSLFSVLCFLFPFLRSLEMERLQDMQAS
jgi:hypothetical protein